MRRLLLPMILGLLWFSGCGESRPEPGGDAGGEAIGDGAQPTANDSPGAPADGAGSEAPFAGNAALVLEGEGLRAFSVPSGTARPIPFGSAMDSTMDVLNRVQPAPPRERGESFDCRALYATWENGLMVWFAEGRFVGWAVNRGDGTLTTASGVGVGSTRAELEASYAARFFESSFGIEFTAGNLAGVLDSSRPDARISNLWAGQACLAR